MRPLKVAFLWHMHQPMYQESVDGRFLLPWVRLHAIKGYFDMPSVLAKHPKAKASFNLTPSLLIQMEEYFKEDIRERDEFLRLSLKPACELELHEKEFIVANFFMNNWGRVIKPHPRYSELLRLRGELYRPSELGQIALRFTDQDMIDLAVLFNLYWFGFTLRHKDPKLKELIKKQRSYTEDDKVDVISVQLAAMREMIVLYKALAERGQAELTTTPFYHPILPLLYNDGRGEGYNWREDAKTHLERGLGLFERVFGARPKGLWPSEGSVSASVAQLASEVGFEWMGTDEEILFHSLSGSGITKDKVLYAPYRFERDGRGINIFFRDKKLSDLIGFSYANSDAHSATSDFIHRLKEIHEKTSHQSDPPVVSVILDGENAWEYYENDGESFLNTLYERLSHEHWIEMVRFSDVTAHRASDRKLDNLFTGSWINHNFQIWYGHHEDRQAWDYLAKTREFLLREDLPADKKARAWEELYIAQGSDWFWWYGDEFSSATQEIFDFLFRNHLMNVYRVAGQRIPVYLQKPIKQSAAKNDYVEEPTAMIYPKIDGEVSGFYEWAGAGRFKSIEPSGAMKKGDKWIEDIYFGANLEYFYVRVDFERSALKGPLDGIKVQFYLASVDEYIFEVELASGNVAFSELRANDRVPLRAQKSWAAFKSTLEISIPFDSLSIPVRNNIELKVSVFKDAIKLEEVPQFGILRLARPDMNTEKSFWSV